jgi:hypothetical protein
MTTKLLKRVSGLAFGGAALAAAFPLAAAAQEVEPSVDRPLFDRGNNESVRDRDRPEFEPTGAPLGAFRLYPSVGLTLGHTDNIFAAETTADADSYVDATAAAVLTSQWSRHGLRLSGDVNHREFADFDEESATTWGAGLDARLDILRGTYAFAGLTTREGREGRGTNDPNGLAELIEVDTDRATLGFNREAGRLRIRLEGEYYTADFTDAPLRSGGFADQDFRDEEARTLRGRVDLAVSPDTALFVAASQTVREFDNPTGSPVRDFDTNDAILGASFDLSQLLRGEIGLGYVWSSYESAAFNDVEGIAAATTLEWFPSQLTTVRLDLRRGIAPAGILDAAAVTRTDVGLSVDHELRRNVIVGGQIGFVEGEFEDLDRQDSVTRFAVTGDWLVNRVAALNARVERREQDSEGVSRGRTFDVTEFSLGATLRR